jgi:GNAT superfamily N-acetyltransferase
MRTPASISVRAGTAADMEALLGLVRELAVYERAEHEVRAVAEDFLRDGFGEAPAFRTLVAIEDAGTMVGFALYFFGYSTWEGRPVLYLEDLFVKQEQRGLGLGRRLMRALATRAKEAHCTRFEWRVLDWNAPAIRFYESLGAELLRDWRVVRIEGAALQNLAMPA